MATIFVDNVQYEVADGDNLLHACLSLGFNLPYFCWHPAMHSVGACRQCAVKQFRDENDTRGRIVMACMTPVANGMRISVADPEATAFRASVVEWLMESHPHDCPVCDEGGECHLQDMTLMTGHNYRRYRFKKRTHRNQYLGPLVNHEMNRCIECYRCVRYYRDYADGRDLNVYANRNHVYFGRAEEGVLESEFAGNLVEVCPTGVFTDKTFGRHYTRKWDLETGPSICVHCSVGCNTFPGARYGELRRIVNRFNGQVNGYFLCDRGRYGYEFVNSPQKIKTPIIRTRAAQSAGPGSSAVAWLSSEEARPREVLDFLGMELKRTGVIGIGSPRASLEANYTLRMLVGPQNFYAGVSETDFELSALALDLMRHGPARTPSMEEVRQSDGALILGEDVTNTAPVIALALRQTARQAPIKRVMKALRIPRWDDGAIREAIQQETGPFFSATLAPTKLDEVSSSTYHAAPENIARLGFAVASAIRGDATGTASLPLELHARVTSIAQGLLSVEKPIVVSGTGLGSEAVMRSAAAVAWALCDAGKSCSLSFALPEVNSLGLAMMEPRPFSEAIETVRGGTAGTVIVLENDLYRRSDAVAVDSLLDAAERVVSLDYLASPTTERSDVVLPVGSFAESDGTFVSQEGRAQRFYQVLVTKQPLQESWRWLRDIMVAGGSRVPEAWASVDDVIQAMAAELPQFAGVTEIAPLSSFRIAGMKVARDTHRYSGRTAMNANIDVSEPKPPEDPDSPLSFTMEGYYGEMPPALYPRFWAPEWNSWAQSVGKFQQEVGGPLRGGDPGVRLIEPSASGRVFLGEVPEPFRRREGEWLALPLHHIFGSEELSILSPWLSELAPVPYIALNPSDAEALRFVDGTEVEIPLGGSARRLRVSVIDALPAGVVGLPSGLAGLTGIVMPTWIKLGTEA